MTTTKIESYIQLARNQFFDDYDRMHWLTPETAATASQKRENLLVDIFKTHARGPGWKAAGTKLFVHDISYGCTLCGRGDWSCLFINNICNARCFYCPAAQVTKDQPMTSTLAFSNPNDYADYVNRFNIRGVSFSGGEPFMTFDRVLKFLKTLRARVTHPLYIWMYTNGLLVTQDKLKALKDKGLDEIRFDISANNYRLDALKKAIQTIPTVTVEIPAIPEDIENTKQVIKQLYDTGVDYLNLHQIRCTPFNQPGLRKKGYTFVHGPGVTVLETELAALELIQYVLDHQIKLPVNYCSFTYRNQFQRAGSQRRNALLIKKEHEDVTAVGRIRSLSVLGSVEQINAIDKTLLATQSDPAAWQVSQKGDQLFFNAALWPYIDFSRVCLKVGYSGTRLKSSVSFAHPFKEISLNRRKKVVVERQTIEPGIVLKEKQIEQFNQKFIQSDAPEPAADLTNILSDPFEIISEYESFFQGLAKYI